MTKLRYPVFDCHPRDVGPEFGPVGRATTERGAQRILRRHYRGTGRDHTPQSTLLSLVYARAPEGWYDMSPI